MPESHFSRRHLLKVIGAGLLGAFLIARLFNRARPSGPIQHILPTVTHNQFLIKVSFWGPKKAVQLSVTRLQQVNHVAGKQTDSRGRFWLFRVSGLASETNYTLQLSDATDLIDKAWPLKTFPSPDSHPDSLKLICYTCAGGPDGFSLPGGKNFFKPHFVRHKIFDAAIAMRPDAVVAIGDHIYWDLRGNNSATVGSGFIGQIITWYLKHSFGAFDRTQRIIGCTSDNEAVLTAIGDDQIAHLYGTRFKSIPMFFVADDHDYFENDDADLLTFPPQSFNRRAHAAIADLYYPAFLSAPAYSPGIDSERNNRSFGTLRYGKLVEIPMFDCAGYLTMEKTKSVLFPSPVEDWLVNKIASDLTQHLALIPSHPLAWTAGKWREWYPDVVAPNGEFTGLGKNKLFANIQGVLSNKAQKAGWQKGWWLQHQRLIQAIDKNRSRPTILLSGDIHALGAKSIERSGDIDLSKRPIQSLLVGPISTSDMAWPSSARSITAATPGWLKTSDRVETNEDNGFTLVKFNRSGIQATSVNFGGGPKISNMQIGKVHKTTITLV